MADSFAEAMRDAIRTLRDTGLWRGPEPVYVKDWVPEPSICEECGQPTPGYEQERPHVPECPCLWCVAIRRITPSPLFGAAGKTITFRKFDPVYRVEY